MRYSPLEEELKRLGMLEAAGYHMRVLPIRKICNPYLWVTFKEGLHLDAILMKARKKRKRDSYLQPTSL